MLMTNRDFSSRTKLIRSLTNFFQRHRRRRRRRRHRRRRLCRRRRICRRVQLFD